MTLAEDPTFGTDSMENMRPLTGADIIRQLSIEIDDQYRSRGGLKGFTEKLGVDYLTYRRYVKGERKMPTDLLMDSLATLEVDPIVFFTLLRARIEAEGSAPEPR